MSETCADCGLPFDSLRPAGYVQASQRYHVGCGDPFGTKARDAEITSLRSQLDAERAASLSLIRTAREDARRKAIEEALGIAENQLEQYRAMSARLPGDSMSRELATVRAETVSLLIYSIRALLTAPTEARSVLEASNKGK